MQGFLMRRVRVVIGGSLARREIENEGVAVRLPDDDAMRWRARCVMHVGQRSRLRRNDHPAAASLHEERSTEWGAWRDVARHAGLGGDVDARVGDAGGEVFEGASGFELRHLVTCGRVGRLLEKCRMFAFFAANLLVGLARDRRGVDAGAGAGE
jgi:hypothetical protein